MKLMKKPGFYLKSLSLIWLFQVGNAYGGGVCGPRTAQEALFSSGFRAGSARDPHYVIDELRVLFREGPRLIELATFEDYGQTVLTSGNTNVGVTINNYPGLARDGFIGVEIQVAPGGRGKVFYLHGRPFSFSLLGPSKEVISTGFSEEGRVVLKPKGTSDGPFYLQWNP